MKKIIFTLLVLVLLALAGCTGTTEDADETGVGYGAPTLGDNSGDRDSTGGILPSLKKVFTRDTTDLEITVPSNPLDEGAALQAEVTSVNDGVADLQFTYSVPGTFVNGAARDVSVILIDVQLVGIDAMMQDFATFSGASMSGADTGGYDNAYETLSGAGWDGTYYNDVDGGVGSGDGVHVSNTGEETYFDNDVDDDGISNSDDDDIDGDGEKNDVDDDDDGDDVDDDDDAFPEDDEQSIWGASDGGLMIFSDIFEQIMDQITNQQNTESMLEGMGNARGMNSYMMTLGENVNTNLAGITDYSDFITDSYVSTGGAATDAAGGTFGGGSTTTDSDGGTVTGGGSGDDDSTALALSTYFQVEVTGVTFV